MTSTRNNGVISANIKGIFPMESSNLDFLWAFSLIGIKSNLNGGLQAGCNSKVLNIPKSNIVRITKLKEVK